MGLGPWVGVQSMGLFLGSSSFLSLECFPCSSQVFLLISQGPHWVLLLFSWPFFDFYLSFLFLPNLLPHFMAICVYFLPYSKWTEGTVLITSEYRYSDPAGGKLFQSRKCVWFIFLLLEFTNLSSKEVNQMSCSDCFLFKERKFTTMRERRERESILGKLAPSHNHLCWPLCLFLHHF